MTTMHRILNPGKVIIAGGLRPVFVEIEWTGERLSLHGVEGPKANGDAWGSCGQIDIAAIYTYNTGWTYEIVTELREVWKRWHLNDMQAGTPQQMAFLEGANLPHGMDWYANGKTALRLAGLDPDSDTGYVFGSAWLHESVPQDVLDWLFSLPVSKIIPAWV